MDKVSQSDKFLLSLNRCADSAQFIPTFYEKFIGASDEIARKFIRTNFKEQNIMLLRSLRLIAGAVAGERPALQELRERAESHDRHHLDIEPRLYDVWKDILIEVAGQFDPLWNDGMKEAWDITLGHVVNQMVKHY